METRVREAIEAAHDKKAIDLEVLHVAELTSLADYFMICSGSTERQTGAIADSIEERLREKLDTRPRMVEGVSPGRWILMDYGDFIVHIFTEETRRFYALDRLWGDARDVAKLIAAGEKPKQKPAKEEPLPEEPRKPARASATGKPPKKKPAKAADSRGVKKQTRNARKK
ncbi:MAG: ribosome silencing factor [Acidobacteria bacterium]|nr:ribosome silencing factor [Acidobacteriota bacterium]